MRDFDCETENVNEDLGWTCVCLAIGGSREFHERLWIPSEGAAQPPAEHERRQAAL